MLLVAVVGPVGAGKSTALASVLAHAAAEGRRVSGFSAEASDRSSAGQGAGAYALCFAGDAAPVPYAWRTPGALPPYHFDAAAEARLDAWAAALTPGLDLVGMDEFGRREAGGEGLMRLWPQVEAAAPAIVVLAVRDTALADVEARLGRSFDAIIPAGTPHTEARLAALLVAHDDWARVGRYGALGGAVEVGLGSALHAGQVPARGLVLSTLQALVLLACGRGLARRVRLAWLPLVTAGLKALSPAGNRLRPMLAITVQGLLFSAATTVLGWNAVGLFVGGLCCGAWAAAQGLALGAVLVGPASIRAAYVAASEAIGHALGVSPPSLAVAAGLWALAWGLVSGGATLAAWLRLPEGRLDAWLHRRAVRRPAGRAGGAGWLVGTLREVGRPVFWAPLLIVAVLAGVAQGSWGTAGWTFLRALALGFVLFALARRIRIDRFAAWLRRRGAWGPAVALDEARKDVERGA